MWSGVDGLPIRTLEMSCSVLAITIDAGNTLIIGDAKGRVSVWDGGAPLETGVRAVAIGQDGRLFVLCSRTQVYEL
eukprot:m.394178 g.394178  ORF g.394178 m.394178 type:complete len:76 (-) comp28338_c2_seq3:794-1021(-)